MRTSLLSEELLQSLMEAGQTDVLAGLLTRDNAATVGGVASAVLAAFRGRYTRQRTVLLNLDAGSTDGTPEIVQKAAAEQGDDLLPTAYTLRSIHRITAPYHGVPDRNTALRVLFTAADLLCVRAVVVLDPTAPSTREDVERWISAVLSEGADYVKPSLPRRFREGPLITELIRPLFAAAYGFHLLEPIDTQLSCSGAFAVDALGRDFWSVPQAEVGIDAFLSAHAMLRRYHLAQVATSAQAHPDPGRRLSVSAVFTQVVSSALACLARAPAEWLAITSLEPVATIGAHEAPRSALPRFDIGEFGRAFRLGVGALPELIVPVVGRPLYERLEHVARAEPLDVSDELWADVVFACVGAALRGLLPVARLAQMLEPLYLGRVASHFAREGEGLAAAIEEAPGKSAASEVAPLVRTFEARKAALSEWWSSQREGK